MSHLVNIREDVVVPESLDFKTYIADRPTYRRLVVPPTGNSTVDISAATSDSYFEITPNVVNLSQSHLEYTVNIPAADDDMYTYVYHNKPNIQAISLYTKSGVNIVQVDYLNKMIWAIGRKYMKFSDYICRSNNSTCNPLHGNGLQFIRTGYAAENKETGQLIFNAGAIGATVTVGSAVSEGSFGVAKDSESKNQVFLLTTQSSFVDNIGALDKRPDGTMVEDRFLENQYVSVSDHKDEKITYNIRFPLSDICETLFSMNRDLYFKENLIMKVTWEPMTMFAYKAINDIDPSEGAEAWTASANFKLTGVQLRLAVQTNRKLIESTMALVNSGLSIDIPFVTVLRNGTTANQKGNPVNVNVKINNGMGRSLLKVIHTMYDPSENSNTAFDSSNRNQLAGNLTGKLDSYYTQLNSQRLQDYNLQCSTVDVPKDDYQWNEYYIKNSPIFNSNVYISNWFHEDNFSNINNDSKVSENQLASPGIPLDTEMTWYFFGQAGDDPSNINHHTFVVTRKTLNISPMGVMIK